MKPTLAMQSLHQTPLTAPATRLPRRFVHVALAIALLFMAKFALYAWLVTPLWDIPDESGHYSFVESLAEGEYPKLGEARMGLDVTHSWRGPEAKPGMNWIAQHPPLYYALDVPFLSAARMLGMDFEQQVRSARLLSSILGGLTLLGLMLFLAQATGNQPISLAGAILAAATPMFTHLSTGVSHDPLVACTVSWAAYFCVRWLQSDRVVHLLLCAFLVGLGAVTKITVLAMAVPFYFCMAWMLWLRSRHAGVGITRCTALMTATWMAMFLPVCAWLLRNFTTYGQWMPDASTLSSTRTVAIGFSELMLRHPFWQHTWLNFIALVGWNGSPDGSLKWIQATGLYAKYFSLVFAVPALLALQPPKLRNSDSKQQALLTIMIAVLLAGLFAVWPLHTVALRTCLLLAVMAITTLAYNLHGASTGKPQAWLLVTAASCFLLFAFIYYHHLWASYTGIMRATHGRYFYPILPMLILLICWPLCRPWLDRGFLLLSVIAMVVADGFYLHRVFPLFGLP